MPRRRPRLVLSGDLLAKVRAVQQAADKVGGDVPVSVLELSKIELADELLAAVAALQAERQPLAVAARGDKR